MNRVNNNTALAASLVLGLVGGFTPVTVASISNSSHSPALSSLAPVLKKVLPTVVSIEVEGTQVERQRLPEEFRFFFGPNFPTEQFKQQPFRGQGSGVIVNAEKGYVITNHHVIKGASKIGVLLANGRRLEAKLIGKDPQTDIALLQLNNQKNLQAITLADSDKLQVGDFAIAVGNPFGIGQTATSGIISALGRSGLSVDGIENFIQTDAAINSGNSGGALVNLQGELIGINTAILAPNGGNIGIGFAIPSNMVKSFIEQIIKFGRVRQVMLGITGNSLDSSVARALNLGVQQGAVVSEVIPGSAADKAGIKAGDIIVGVNGKPVQSFPELRAKLVTLNSEQLFPVDLIREGKPKQVSVRLQFVEPTQINSQRDELHPLLKGVGLRNHTIKGTKGVEITKIDKGALARQHGLQEGDLIVEVNQKRITSVSELSNLLASKPEALALKIQRGDALIYLILH
ncbi:MAG: Do family serine endopeptidase [Candidatus Symbiodolus clandestinus]